jgi:hypothetical protein
MAVTTWLDGVSLPLLFIITLLYALVAIVIGIRLSALGNAPIESSSIGPATGATLGLFAFMLAFTFNMTASRFDGRKQLVMDEVNAIGSAYLRSDLLPSPYDQRVSALIEEYARLRASMARAEISVSDAILRSESLQNEMWQQVRLITEELPPSTYSGLFIRSLNEMIDMQGSRVILGTQFRIPQLIWLGLYAIAGLSMMLVGYQLGATGKRRIVVSCTLAAAFSSVIFMIADLDRSESGFATVNQQPYFDLVEGFDRKD